MNSFMVLTFFLTHIYVLALSIYIYTHDYSECQIPRKSVS